MELECSDMSCCQECISGASFADVVDLVLSFRKAVGWHVARNICSNTPSLVGISACQESHFTPTAALPDPVH
eukprot:3620850-Amphidinium_carterae.1